MIAFQTDPSMFRDSLVFTVFHPSNRITQAATSNSSWIQQFGYDATGNGWVATNNNLPAPTQETPLAQSWFTAANRINGWTYDETGNILQIGTTPSLSRIFTYDAENRQITATINGGTPSSYVYDGEGRRVQATTASGTTTFVYDAAGRLAQEYSTATPTDTGTSYMFADHLGSTRLITDGSGNIKKRFDYLPFGEEILASYGSRTSAMGYNTGVGTPDIERLKFTSKERDAETGLDYFGARYFSSAQGRFTGPDAPLADQHPEDPQSWNMYAYVRNNPLKNTDPNGRDCFQGLSSCGDYLIGGLKAAVNVVPNTATLLNRGINFLTGSNIPDAPTLQPSNVDQAQGMEAANVMIAISPVAELGVARSAATAATEVPQITQNALRGAESETRVLNDMGLTKNTTPITGTAGRSIPDINTSTMIGDIKDAKTVSNTPQMQIQREVAGQTGKDHVIVTGTNTHVTGPTQQPPTKIIRRDDLGPKQP